MKEHFVLVGPGNHKPFWTTASSQIQPVTQHVIHRLPADALKYSRHPSTHHAPTETDESELSYRIPQALTPAFNSHGHLMMRCQSRPSSHPIFPPLAESSNKKIELHTPNDSSGKGKRSPRKHDDPGEISHKASLLCHLTNPPRVEKLTTPWSTVRVELRKPLKSVLLCTESTAVFDAMQMEKRRRYESAAELFWSSPPSVAGWLASELADSMDGKGCLCCAEPRKQAPSSDPILLGKVQRRSTSYQPPGSSPAPVRKTNILVESHYCHRRQR